MNKDLKVSGLYFFVLCVIIILSGCGTYKHSERLKTDSLSSVRAKLHIDSLGTKSIKIDSAGTIISNTNGSWYNELTITDYDTSGKKKRETTYKHGGSTQTATNQTSNVSTASNASTNLKKDDSKSIDTHLNKDDQSGTKTSTGWNLKLIPVVIAVLLAVGLYIKRKISV